jgi:hypothetical protein
MVFKGDLYYPKMGFDDFADSFNTSAEAQHYLMTATFDWAQIVDFEDEVPVQEFHRSR